MGPGGFGQERARALKAHPRIEFVASYSPIEAEMRACEAEFGARPVRSDRDIWNDPEIDGIILSTPNQLHLQQAKCAAEAGMHIFVEKPLAPTAADSREIVEACQAAGVVLMVGHNARRRTRIRTIKRYLEQGRLGQVVAAEANNSHAGGLTIPPGNWRSDHRNTPGGPLIQLGIHKIDVLHYLLGPIARVSAWQRHLAIPVDVEDVTMALLEFESGVLGYLGAHYAIPDQRFIHVLGTQGNLRWDRAMGLVFETAAGRESIPIEENDTLYEEIDEFVRCILDGKSPETGGAEGLAAVAVVEAALLSSQRGRPVDVSEVLGL